MSVRASSEKRSDPYLTAGLDISMTPGPDSPTLDRGYVRHPDSVWSDPTYATDPIAPAVDEWLTHLVARPTPASPETVRKYRNSLASFVGSLTTAGDAPILANLTRSTVDRWTSQQRFRGLAAEGIASRLAALKAFSRSFLYLEAEYTTVDLLAKVKRPKPEEGAKPMLDEEERDAVFKSFDDGGYTETRNDAFVTALLSTGLRFKAVLEMRLDQLDRATGDVTVLEKGGVERPVRLSPGAMKKLRRWLRVRRAAEGVQAVWTTEEGSPLTYWGGQSIFRRLKKRSGVPRLHAHLLRHTFGQGAMVKGATPGETQDMLGHKTPAMTRRYTKSVSATVAAVKMPRYALV